MSTILISLRLRNHWLCIGIFSNLSVCTHTYLVGLVSRYLSLNLFMEIVGLFLSSSSLMRLMMGSQPPSSSLLRYLTMLLYLCSQQSRTLIIPLHPSDYDTYNWCNFDVEWWTPFVGNNVLTCLSIFTSSIFVQLFMSNIYLIMGRKNPWMDWVVLIAVSLEFNNIFTCLINSFVVFILSVDFWEYIQCCAEECQFFELRWILCGLIPFVNIFWYFKFLLGSKIFGAQFLSLYTLAVFLLPYVRGFVHTDIAT